MSEPEGEGRRFTLPIHKDDDGMLWTEVAELPGCFASGKDMDELLEAASEAIAMYLSEEAPPTKKPGTGKPSGGQVVKLRRIRDVVPVEAIMQEAREA